MANRIKLTPGRIAALTLSAGKDQEFTWDSSVNQLAVRVTAGAKSYIFQSRLTGGRSLRMTIGNTAAWDIARARAEANRLQTLVDQGKDPRQEKAATVAAVEAGISKARRHDVTVAEAWSAYIAKRQTGQKKWGDRSAADHVALVKPGGEKRKHGTGTIRPGILYSIMALRLNDLTSEKVSDWLAKENQTRPARAALSYRLLRAFVRWCATVPEYRDAAHVDAVGAAVAREYVRTSKPKHGDCLQREQLKPWFRAVRQLDNPVSSAYLQTLLLTGSRRNEWCGLKWVDVDFQWGSARISDKIEDQRLIPLTPYVASLIAALPRRNGFVFSSVGAHGGRMISPRTPHNRALQAAGLPHLTIHGLRRSFATLSEWVEAPTGVVAQIMGHAPSALAEKHYLRRPLDLLRMWHTRIEAWILAEAGIAFEPTEERGLRVVPSGKD